MHYKVQVKGYSGDAVPPSSSLSSDGRSPNSRSGRWLTKKGFLRLLICCIIAAMILVLMVMRARYLQVQSTSTKWVSSSVLPITRHLHTTKLDTTDNCTEYTSSSASSVHRKTTRGASKATTIRRRRRLDRFKNYVVFSPKCKIPNIPKFHDDVRRYYRQKFPHVCSDQPMLTSVTHSGGDSRYILNLHDENSDIYVRNGSGLHCCYSLIITDSKYWSEGECQLMKTNNTVLDEGADLVHVECVDDHGINVYMMSHFLVPIKSTVRQKMERFDNGSSDFLSVMIVGLDSVSRLGLLRNLPETAKYLDDNGWYSFHGYHKVGTNTFHNLNGPVLSGRRGIQLKHMCWLRGRHLDGCPFIWKNYSAKNYITAYGEDMPRGDSLKYFGQESKGFKRQPTDYLLRPLVQFVESTQGLKKDVWSVPECIGPKKAVDYILEFAADFASFFIDFPTFSLFWFNAGHVELNGAQALDRPVLEYFQRLGDGNVLNRTMVVFMSDHGLRRSGFRKTRMGFVEDSMPFLYIWLPEWFRQGHPDKADNLRGNSYRLVSHFDLHLTLMDVLGAKAKAPGCPECVSLFEPVPWDRGCFDAGISPSACVCTQFKEVPIDSKVHRLAGYVALHINDQAKLYSEDLESGYKCANVVIKNVTSARRDRNSDGKFGQMYVLMLITSPNYAELEAVVEGDTGEVTSVTEMTVYHHRSFCMNSREGKSWCTCELDGNATAKANNSLK